MESIDYKNILERSLVLEQEIVDDKRKLKKVNIFFVDYNNCLRVLQKKVLLKKKLFSYEVRYEKLYLLNSKEIKKLIENLSLDEYYKLNNYLGTDQDISNSHYRKLLKKKYHLKKWCKRQYKRTLIVLSIVLGLSYINLKKDYGNIENAFNSLRIVGYLKDNDSLTEEEIDELLRDINEDIRKITDDSKFDIDNVDTNEEIENYFLLNAINLNKEMTKKEKELYLNFYEFYNDNPYLDKLSLYERLCSLEFTRENEISDDKKIAISKKNGTLITYATYSPFNNEITYYYKPDSETSIHEGVHCNLCTFNIPISIDEGMAEIIKNEYFDYDEFIYDRNTSLTKALIEIVGKDTLLKSISLDDSSYLKEALVNNLIHKGRKKEEALEITNKFLEDIDRSFYDNELSYQDAKKIDLKQFYVYEDHDFESNYRFDILVDDFLKAFYPNNNHYYFNRNDQKELVKH